MLSTLAPYRPLTNQQQRFSGKNKGKEPVASGGSSSSAPHPPSAASSDGAGGAGNPLDRMRKMLTGAGVPPDKLAAKTQAVLNAYKEYGLKIEDAAVLVAQMAGLAKAVRNGESLAPHLDKIIDSFLAEINPDTPSEVTAKQLSDYIKSSQRGTESPYYNELLMTRFIARKANEASNRR